MRKNIDPYWFEGSILEPGNLTLRPIYIQHLPKTGTTTLFVALRSAFDVQFQMIAQSSGPNFIPPKCGRIDDHNFEINDQFVLMASHLPFGFHRQFAPATPHLITIVRDPFSRVYSAYTYGCMRSNTPPSIDGFKDFYQNERNRNVMAKLLSGHDVSVPCKDTFVELAIRNLVDHFVLYGTTKHISQITSQLLKLNKLPNVLCDHLNRTEQKFQIDAVPLTDEVLELNAADIEVFNYVDKKPSIVLSGIFSDNISTPHQRTALVREISNGTEGTMSNIRAASTELIINSIENGRCEKNIFDSFFQ